MKEKALAAALLCFGMLFSPAFAQGKNILIAGDEEKKETGYMMEITMVAFQRTGYAPTFDILPWSRALEGTIHVDYDVLLGAYYSEERTKLLLYTDSPVSTRLNLLKRKADKITFKAIADLKPYRIGGILGARVSPEFDAAVGAYLNVEFVSDFSQNIQKLLDGRIDLAIGTDERILNILSTERFKKDSEKLEILPTPLQVNKLYNCVSKAHPDCQRIVDDFNRGLKMMREDGTLDALYQKYGLSG